MHSSSSRSLAGPIPELEQFLPAWIARLEQVAKPASEWESDADRWLREALSRRDGVAGLERLARTPKRPEVVRAWCD